MYLLTSVSGFFYRRGVLSWLYLLCYSHLCFWACLAVWPGYSSGLFLVSFAFIGILTPICFFFCCLFFLVGLIGKGSWLFTKCFLFSGGAALGFSKLILFLLVLYFIIFFIKIGLNFLFICLENTIRCFLFFFLFFIYIIYYIIKYDFIFFFIYNILIEIITWLYIYVVVLYWKCMLRIKKIFKILFVCISFIKLLLSFFVLFLFKNNIFKKSTLTFNVVFFQALYMIETNISFRKNIKFFKILHSFLMLKKDRFYYFNVTLEQKRIARENASILKTLYEDPRFKQENFFYQKIN